MVVVFVLLGIILLGVVIGLVRRPKTQAAQRAFAKQVKALSLSTGWQFDTTPVPPLQMRFLVLDNVLGSTVRDGISVRVQLTGHWRGAPVRVLQLSYWKDRVAVKTAESVTMIMVPRPVPGPTVTLTAQGLSWANFPSSDCKIGYPPFDDRYHVHAKNVQEAQAVLTPPVAGQLAADPRMQERILFFAPEDVAAVFPGYVTQQEITIATADLLADLTRRMIG